jgi:hypothetical protein
MIGAWKLRLLAVLLVSACSPEQTRPSAQVQETSRLERLEPVTLTELQRRTIEERVREKLKDPDSARFDGFQGGRDDNGFILVCGWVNAKNSYGGYMGRQPFDGIMIVEGEKIVFVPSSVGGSDPEISATLEVCRQQGIEPT